MRVILLAVATIYILALVFTSSRFRVDFQGIVFPLNDASGRYTIEKVSTPVVYDPDWCPQARYTTNYTLSYAPKTGKSWKNVMIGDSRPQLDDFVGKSIRIVGTFDLAGKSTQCIGGKCHLIFGNDEVEAVVINIENIEEGWQ